MGTACLPETICEWTDWYIVCYLPSEAAQEGGIGGNLIKQLKHGLHKRGFEHHLPKFHITTKIRLRFEQVN